MTSTCADSAVQRLAHPSLTVIDAPPLVEEERGVEGDGRERRGMGVGEERVEQRQTVGKKKLPLLRHAWPSSPCAGTPTNDRGPRAGWRRVGEYREAGGREAAPRRRALARGRASRGPGRGT